MQSIVLSDRERAVLLGIMNGQTYGQIAYGLGLSHETVKSYSTRLRAKLGVASRIGLALWAAKNLEDAET